MWGWWSFFLNSSVDISSEAIGRLLASESHPSVLWAASIRREGVCRFPCVASLLSGASCRAASWALSENHHLVYFPGCSSGLRQEDPFARALLPQLGEKDS